MIDQKVGGTMLYCARNVHMQIVSYKNDFECLGVIIIEMLTNNIPWKKTCMALAKAQNIPDRNKLDTKIYF